MFRSRKRGREIQIPPKAESDKAHHHVSVADVTTATAVAEKQQHPVAAFANTVYVDPVIKVRERSTRVFANSESSKSPPQAFIISSNPLFPRQLLQLCR